MDFNKAYARLNSAQKKAVDAIDGPVMVIAGPGTGKTQLLSVRVANILNKTDSLPDNILCLTYTEAAATEMKERLVKLIGQQGYDVNVLTFHSFGTEIINRYPAYFYSGATMTPIDEVTSYTVLLDIFTKLPHSNPLSSTFTGEYVFLKDAQQAIGQLKKAAISPAELRDRLKSQQEFVDWFEPEIVSIFSAGRLSKKMLPDLQKAVDKAMLNTLSEGQIVLNELSLALEDDDTKPITKWKAKWLEKSPNGELVLKDRARIAKLMALADVYEEYQKSITNGHWFDYDDMIMQAIEQVSTNPTLMADLQEQYQYILVDEFQDTNDAQLKLIKLLADNPVNEGRPNILVVGDDDQAIYKFQGADISNMHQFAEWVRSPEIVTLTDIYRYSKPLLDLSTSVIDNATIRIKESLGGGNQLHAVPDHDFVIDMFSYDDEYAEYDNVAKQIIDLIKSGQDPNEIAIIGRQHNHLEKFAEYATANNLAVKYDRQEDILSSQVVTQLTHFARVVLALAAGNAKQVDTLMPELMSYRFWGIAATKLWQINSQARAPQQSWIDVMLQDPDLQDIANYLLELAQSTTNDPLNVILDKMIGYQDGYFYQYFFDKKASTIDQKYLQLVADLKTIKQKSNQYGGAESKLQDFIDFIDIQTSAKIKLNSTNTVTQAEKSVSLLSAHGSKGMEFECVFILHAQDGVWGAGKRGRSSKLSWTSNLNIAPAGDDHDDRVRLFYVAITRAKQKLVLSSARNFGNKTSLPLRLVGDHIETTNVSGTTEELAKSYILDWTDHHYLESQTNKSSLQPLLEKYRLSISHLQNFVDVANNGPTMWLINNLIKFPGPSIPAAAYGSAVHATLNEAQKFLTNHQKPKPIKDLLADFELNLQAMQLSADDYTFYLDRGKLALENFFDSKYQEFSPKDKSEVNFYGDDIAIGGAKITGLADRINLIDGDFRTGKIAIVDYKTGKALSSWHGKDDIEKTKAHNYRQQLMFYQLMLNRSKRFKHLQIVDSRLDFVEPNKAGELVSLSLEFDKQELQRLEQIITGAWKLICKLDLPDVSNYSPDIKGRVEFEDYLISLN